MKKAIASLLLCVFCMMLFTGCWDSTELNERGIAEAIGLDQNDKTGEINITVQVVRVGALKTDGATEKSPIENMTASGKTVFEAIRNVCTQSDRKAYFAHTKVIVVGERLARAGIGDIVDVFMRNHEGRPLCWVMVGRNATAEKLLGVEHGLEEIQGAYLNNMIQKCTMTSKTSASTLLDLAKILSGDVGNPVTGAMEVVDQPIFPAEQKETQGDTTQGIQLTGTSVFQKDKLVGYLDAVETRGLNLITGKMKSGIIDVPSPFAKNKLFSIVVLRTKSKIDPKIENGTLSFHITVDEEADIGEQQGSADISKPEVFEKVEKAYGEVLANEIKATVNKAQKELRTDILGFGGALNRKYPQEWKRVQDNWKTLFPDVPYTVSVSARLLRTGMEIKSIQQES
ncbi:MAG: Ger(x)C family spore germination protein [Clostridiales bacterium]|nr:Ger(x)C family spore germination protein [Clostridiales bacterium]